MSEDENGKPIISVVHLIDAFIVGSVVFFSLLLGATLPGFVSSDPIYLTPSQVETRLITAGIGFCLTFFAQWARYRGVELVRILNGHGKENGGP